MERRQVPLYLVAIGCGAVLGLTVPALGHPAAWAINPALGLLLYATFLGIPLGRIGEGLRDWRFLATVLGLNFLVVPAVVWLVSRIVAHDRALLVGVLFVLLTPCVDYVVVFTRLAGGSEQKLLAATPVLMAAQLALLPGYLWLFAGGGLLTTIDWARFARAFAGLILVPLLAAALTQWASTRSVWVARLGTAASRAMVPLMMITLTVVVASQIARVSGELGALAIVVPVFLLFAAVMVPLGVLAGRLAGLDVPDRRAVVFSGVTRNSLVILPLVLALPTGYELSALVVVTQTLIEVITMVVLVRWLPRWTRIDSQPE